MIMEKILKVEGMHCSHCSARVEKALLALGLKSEISLEKGEVKVTGDVLDDKAIKDAIEDLGFIVH